LARDCINLRKFLENVKKIQAHWESLKDDRDPRKILGNTTDSQKKSQEVRIEPIFKKSSDVMEISYDILILIFVYNVT